MNLSKDFQLVEFLRSESAARMGRQIIPPEAVSTQLVRLCNCVLQPLRDTIGRPMVISSGYRPSWLNIIIGGSATSAHMFGRAADLRILGLTNFQAATEVAKLIHALPIDQLIYEYGQWVHIGIAEPTGVIRREILTATRQYGKTVYTPGLIQQKEDV